MKKQHKTKQNKTKTKNKTKQISGCEIMSLNQESWWSSNLCLFMNKNIIG